MHHSLSPQLAWTSHRQNLHEEDLKVWVPSCHDGYISVAVEVAPRYLHLSWEIRSRREMLGELAGPTT